MSFDLTNKNIQDTFQNVLQQTGSTGEVYDLAGNRVTDVNINTISSSVVTSSIIEIPNTSNQTGNKLHARSGVLYFGGTNLEDGSSDGGGGIFATTGSKKATTNNIEITGSLTTKAINATDDFFLLKSGSLDSLKVNNQGVLVLGGFTFEPTAIKGGVYYNDNEDEFYAGKQN